LSILSSPSLLPFFVPNEEGDCRIYLALAQKNSDWDGIIMTELDSHCQHQKKSGLDKRIGWMPLGKSATDFGMVVYPSRDMCTVYIKTDVHLVVLVFMFPVL
jgi:hypothetical protein